MNNAKLEALKEVLVKNLGYTKEQAEKNANRLYNDEFLVYTEEEANKAVFDRISEIVNKLGLEAFSDNFQKIILRNYVENDKDFMIMFIEQVISEYKKQKLDKNEYIRKRIQEDIFDTGYESYAEYFFDEYGNVKDLLKMLKIDIEHFAKDCIDMDIREVFLSADDKEYRENGFLIYTNPESLPPKFRPYKVMD